MVLRQMPVRENSTVRVLIVEDEPTISVNVEDDLIDAGFQIAGVAAKLDEALALVESGACDAAIVDANLAGVSAGPIASALKIRGLPFIVVSGYSQEQLQGQFSGGRFLPKPCGAGVLVDTLNSLLRQRLAV